MDDDDLISKTLYPLAPCAFGDPTVPLGTLGLPDAAAGPELAVGHLRVRLGDRPVAYDLRQLYLSAHGGDPPDTPAFNGYDLWMIVHCVGVVREQGNAQVEAVGYEVVFGDDRAVYTIDLFPRTELVTTLGGTLQARVALGIEGAAGPAARESTDSGKPALLAGNISLAFSQTANLIGRLSFSLTTPIVMAVGKGSSRCQWHFEKHDQPLFGDHTMVQTVLVPRRTRKLDLKIRGYALIRPRFFSFGARHETEWVEVPCPLVTRPVA